MQTIFELAEEQFAEQFTLIPNYINLNAAWTMDGKGHLFEIFGLELDFILSQDSRRVWKLVDGDGGTYLINGLHFVNRLGYLLSSEPHAPDASIYVTIDEL